MKLLLDNVAAVAMEYIEVDKNRYILTLGWSCALSFYQLLEIIGHHDRALAIK